MRNNVNNDKMIELENELIALTNKRVEMHPEENWETVLDNIIMLAIERATPMFKETTKDLLNTIKLSILIKREDFHKTKMFKDMMRKDLDSVGLSELIKKL